MTKFPQVGQFNKSTKKSKGDYQNPLRMNKYKVLSLRPLCALCLALFVMLPLFVLINSPVPLVLWLLSGRSAFKMAIFLLLLFLGALGWENIGRWVGWARRLSARKAFGRSSPKTLRVGENFHASAATGRIRSSRLGNMAAAQRGKGCMSSRGCCMVCGGLSYMVAEDVAWFAEDCLTW